MAEHLKESSDLDTKEGFVGICFTCGCQDVTAFCVDCSIQYCQLCCLKHLKQPVTSQHSCIPIGKCIQTITDLLTVQCRTHEQSFIWNCKTHNCLICMGCVPKHAGCELLMIESKAKDISPSEYLNDLQLQCGTLLSNAETLYAALNGNNSGLSKRRNELEKNIEKVEKQFKNIITIIRREGMKEIERQEHQLNIIKNNIFTFMTNLEDKCRKLLELEMHLSRSKMLIGIYELEHRLMNMELDVKNVLKEMKLPAFKAYMTLETISASISKFVQVDEDVLTTDIRDIEIRPSVSIDFPSGKNPTKIKGCTILQENNELSGKMFFSDFANDRVLIHNSNGEHKSTIYFNCPPLDVASSSSFKVAVSLSKNNSIAVINGLNESWKEYPIHTGSESLGALAYCNDSLIVRMRGIGFYILNSTLCKLKMIENRGHNMPYITCSNNQIYYTKWDKGCVCCCDMNGKEKWTKQVDTILKPPNGVAADDDGNVFVTGTFSSNIAIISADGSKCIELKTQGKLQNPTSIAYDSKSKKLLVSCSSGKAILFSVIKKSSPKK